MGTHPGDYVRNPDIPPSEGDLFTSKATRTKDGNSFPPSSISNKQRDNVNTPPWNPKPHHHGRETNLPRT